MTKPACFSRTAGLARARVPGGLGRLAPSAVVLALCGTLSACGDHKTAMHMHGGGPYAGTAGTDGAGGRAGVVRAPSPRSGGGRGGVLGPAGVIGGRTAGVAGIGGTTGAIVPCGAVGGRPGGFPGFGGLGLPLGGFGGLAGLQAAPAVPVVRAKTPPPPISGGTLILTSNGGRAVVSDPDRDAVYIADLGSFERIAEIKLEAGDEPGRLVEDRAGRVHVALRGGGAVVSVDPKQPALVERRPACDHPRGIAYDQTTDSLHVACAEGVLLTLPAGGGPPSRSLTLAPDLRDVVAADDRLYVSRFRAAELLVLDAQGQISQRMTPAPAKSMEQRAVQAGQGMCRVMPVEVSFEANVAWRLVRIPRSGVAMLHQRSDASLIGTKTPGGYASGGCGSSIVHASVTSLSASTGGGPAAPAAPVLTSAVLAVDLAVSPGRSRMAVASPGNAASAASGPPLVAAADFEPSLPLPSGLSTQVLVYSAPGGSLPTNPARGQLECAAASRQLRMRGEATSVMFLDEATLVVQSREPAELALFDLNAAASQTPFATIPLSLERRSDSGHALFHRNSGGSIACAQCHAEAGDDGRVWDFEGFGRRRTQHLRGGILGTEPFHWQGDMKDFGMLVHEVFVGRMGGFTPSAEQIEALAQWIDAQPALRSSPADAAAVARGKKVFESQQAACSSCHAGPKLTNSESVDVGTGQPLQVPGLLGLRFRAPYMHNGCAATLEERFGACGGASHGDTSHLTPSELDDLITYLKSL